MADEELEALRAKRMAEMQGQFGGPGGGGQRSQEEQRQQMEQQAAMRNSMLSQVLDQSARGRLSTIAVAKPEKARMIEDMVIQMARSGQIAGKLNEDGFRSILERVSEQTQKKTTVKFNRRRLEDSDED